MAATLQQSVAELRRMEERARRFAADVSHELRTPLTTMIAVSDTLDQDAEHLPGETGTAARLISAETRRLGALVEDLIEISRLDAGTAALRVDEVDLAAAVRTTLSRRAWTDQVVTVLPVGVTVRVDPRRLDVIVANLVANALRHGAPPVTVTAEVARNADRTETFTVTVNDHGNGIPNGALAHLFDRFYKADLARTRSEGSGLGLAIAMENAKLHGGTIEVCNVPGGGAQFRLRLPVHV